MTEKKNEKVEQEEQNASENPVQDGETPEIVKILQKKDAEEKEEDVAEAGEEKAEGTTGRSS
jgi:hypothetical protein